MPSILSIAIIGAGASGTITAIQLLKKLTVPTKIYLIEKNEYSLFRGAAYGSELPYQPLNVQAGRMSIFNEQPDDFYSWLKANKQADTDTEITKDSFVSRRWFGDYLVFNFECARAQTQCVEVEIVTAACINLDYGTNTSPYRLQLDNGTVLPADYVLFACGNEKPGDIFSQEEIVAMGERYISNPWAQIQSGKFNTDEDILFVGTGLTMIDCAVSLSTWNHQGKIYCMSRNGYLPLPHSDIQHFNFEFKEPATELHQALNLVRQNAATAKEQSVSWQNVIDAMRPYTAKIWKQMLLDTKKRFLKKLRPYWEIHRHRMPQASADALDKMQQSEQLMLLAGNYQSVKVTKEGVMFNYFPKGKRQISSFTVQYIVNCTGPSTDYHQTDNLLFKNLLHNGWMKQDALKLGIETGFRGEIIKRNGVILQNAFAIGPLRRASEWETTAIREIRTQAENVANSICLPSERSYDLMTGSGL